MALRCISRSLGISERLPGQRQRHFRGAVEFWIVSDHVRNVFHVPEIVFDAGVLQAVPQRFFSFLAVGGSGVVVQLLCLSEGLNAGLPFAGAQSVATLAAMTSNFLSTIC